MQLDIFEHSRDVMLRNDVVHALERRDGLAARVAWDTLARECPVDECLASLLLLVKAVEGCGQGCPIKSCASKSAEESRYSSLLFCVAP